MKSLTRSSTRLLSAAILIAAACHSPTAPLDQNSQARGRLAGIVTIGPNCPVDQPGQPCPTPPSAYSLRKILVYDAAKTQLVFTVDIDSQGLYAVDLVPAAYLVDLKGVGLDRTSDLPKTVDIHAHVTTTLNVNIDTGLR
ncbi:MAG TPA: hypothetical protein VL284_14365 [Thermoanaerobaculia bacterium]|nr:hypothetical protein [Thermoanaerobaculia bacterium]